VLYLQLEGALAFSERKVKDQLTTIDSLQVSVSAKQQLVTEAQSAGSLPVSMGIHRDMPAWAHSQCMHMLVASCGFRAGQLFRWSGCMKDQSLSWHVFRTLLLVLCIPGSSV
jgi:hypothetical protein